MPMPAVVPIVSAVAAAVGPWVMRFFAAKAVIMLAGFLGRMGLVIATNELVMQPLIDHVTSAWSSIPGSLQCWLGLVGVTKMAGIMVSGITLVGFKKVFLSKS